MKTKNLHPSFMSILLVGLSVASLALFRLQVWVSTATGSRGLLDSLNMDSRVGGWVYYFGSDLVQIALLLTLAAAALAAVFNLRLSNHRTVTPVIPGGNTTVTHRPATNLYHAPASGALN